MWFTREQFEACNELRQLGLEPRFEVGDVVARGFADLGYEEFQLLQSRKLLSLTAGTTAPLTSDHERHFFWIPSVDEVTELLEMQGAVIKGCRRIDGRTWLTEVECGGKEIAAEGRSIHLTLLHALIQVLRANGL